MFNTFEKKTKEKRSEYHEIEFEHGIRLIFRILENQPSLRFIDENGKDLLDLIELAPIETRLRLYTKWGANMEENIPTISVGEFNGIEALFEFLHESGHLHNWTDTESYNTAQKRHDEEKKRDSNNANPNSRLKAMKSERVALLKTEQNAWAFAIKKIVELEGRFDIHIFNRIGGVGKTNERVTDYINKHLDMTNKPYLDELYELDIFSREQMEKFFEELGD